MFLLGVSWGMRDCLHHVVRTSIILCDRQILRHVQSHDGASSSAVIDRCSKAPFLDNLHRLMMMMVMTVLLSNDNLHGLVCTVPLNRLVLF